MHAPIDANVRRHNPSSISPTIPRIFPDLREGSSRKPLPSPSLPWFRNSQINNIVLDLLWMCLSSQSNGRSVGRTHGRSDEGMVARTNCQANGQSDRRSYGRTARLPERWTSTCPSCGWVTFWSTRMTLAMYARRIRTANKEPMLRQEIQAEGYPITILALWLDSGLLDNNTLGRLQGLSIRLRQSTWWRSSHIKAAFQQQPIELYCIDRYVIKTASTTSYKICAIRYSCRSIIKSPYNIRVIPATKITENQIKI